MGMARGEIDFVQGLAYYPSRFSIVSLLLERKEVFVVGGKENRAGKEWENLWAERSFWGTQGRGR